MPPDECFCSSYTIFLFTRVGIKDVWPLQKASKEMFLFGECVGSTLKVWK